MKRLILLFSLLISPIIHGNNSELPKGLTDFEKLDLDQIYEMGRNTEPPLLPIRNIAEYEPMQGVLIRYPFGISLEIISELAEDVNIYCLVSSSLQNAANQAMINGAVNMNNVEYVIGPTDSYWTRDYGPWWIVDGNREVSIVDFTYNRPRPNDNDAPLKVSNYLDVPYYAVDIVHAGGNYMTDGMGISASSNLVYEENSISDENIKNLMEEYYGIQTYHVIEDPNNTYIDHIDCWGKYLSPTKVLIRQVANTHPQYDQIEQTAQYFSDTTNEWGELWEVYRIWTPGDEPYTNSLIINNKIFVPLTGSDWDEGALQTYTDVLPGYEVLGFTGTWQSTDALHCRIKGIPDTQMLQIFHNPLNDGTNPEDRSYEIKLFVDDLSNSGLILDSMKLHWRHSGSVFWQFSQLIPSDNSDEIGGWIGSIPALTDTGIIDYYISSADYSGRIEKSPTAGWHSFIANPTDACESWMVGDLDNSGLIDVIDVLLLTDLIEDTISGICVLSVSDINSDSELTYFDVFTLANSIILD